MYKIWTGIDNIKKRIKNEHIKIDSSIKVEFYSEENCKKREIFNDKLEVIDKKETCIDIWFFIEIFYDEDFQNILMVNSIDEFNELYKIVMEKLNE